MRSMRRVFACAVLLALCIAPCSAGAAQKGARPAHHCGPDEAVIFACPTAGDKLLSICASRQYGPDAGFLQYRYGPAGKPELTLPAAATPPAGAAKSGLWSFSGGGGAYVRFLSGKTAYYVYAAIGKWGKKGAVREKAGVAVEKDGRVTANILCRGAAASELGPEFFEKAGLEAADPGFALPD